MVIGIRQMLGTLVRPGWLTGPIFEKELRVSSRRRRNYWLRSIYILLLAAFVAIVWLGVVEYQGSTAFAQSRMAVAGKRIVMTVVLFQFFATQILAVIMLSTAISDEAYHRTLGLLMTTPINSLQIVMGKMLSKLLQLLLLLGITLPILAIVRVLGGVSWGYLLSSLCITLTAVIFAGSLSLFISIRSRRAYAVIVRAMFVLGCFYFVLPLVLAAVLRVGWAPGFGNTGSTSSIGLLALLMHINPCYGIGHVTQVMLAPGTGLQFSWPTHCTIMLGLSGIVLARAVQVVREIALRQATGQLELTANGRRLALGKRRRTDSVEGPVKRVLGPAVVWKELRAPFIQGVDNRNSYIGLIITVVALLGTYWVVSQDGSLDESFVHASYGLLFVSMGGIFNIVFSATRITSEKESQTWSLLLATPLTSTQVLFGKAVSAFRRCLPIWALLGGHLAIFIFAGYIHPIAVFHLSILILWLTVFVTGAGLYFGTRFNRTTSSVVAVFALALGLWVLGPIVGGMLALLNNRADRVVNYMYFHPSVQTELIMAGASGTDNADLPLAALDYGNERILLGAARRAFGVGRMTVILLGTGAVYIGLGLVFFWRARCRLRRHIF